MGNLKLCIAKIPTTVNEYCLNIVPKPRSKYCSSSCQKYDSSRRWTTNNRDRVTSNQKKRRSVSEYDKLWRKNQASRLVDIDRRYRYSLEPKDFDRMYLMQKGCCAICNITFSDDKKSNKPHIDHDHSCCSNEKTCGKCVRGLLCGNCNRGIGLLREDINNFVRAIKYLSK